MSFSLAVEALHAFIQDESEHKSKAQLSKSMIPVELIIDIKVEWCGGSETKKEILSRLHQREEAAVKRERTMAYALSHQDLVEWQILVAIGEDLPLSQSHTFIRKDLVEAGEISALTAHSSLQNSSRIYVQPGKTQFKPEDITAIMDDFNKPGSLAPIGLYLGGTKYMVI
ncbi:hypothetical protein JHK82_027280 [Glycine max]|nr:hypothetical protein JHK82_027280 [Glycine max]